MSDVLFRGPMMVFKQGSDLTMRIPDGTKKSANMKHPDKDPVRHHYAGLMVATLPAGSGPVPIPLPATQREALSYAKVTISDNSGQASTWDSSLDAMVDLKERTANGATGPLEPRDDQYVVDHGGVVVTFKGGTLSADSDKLTTLEYTVPGHFSTTGVDQTLYIPMVVRWTPTGAAGVTIDIEDDTGTIPTIRLAAGETACVFNWDGKPASGKPTPAEFLDFTAATCESGVNEIIDIDFKWVYDLCKPHKGTWDIWRDGHKLPAPESPCEAVVGAAVPHTAPGKDCLGSRWGGGI